MQKPRCAPAGSVQRSWRAAITALGLLLGSVRAPAEVPRNLVGTVSADRGTVLGLRIKARDVRRRVTYTVFTRHAEFQFPPLPAGTYDVWVGEERSYTSPVRHVILGPRAPQRLKIVLRARPDFEPGSQFRPRDPHVPAEPEPAAMLVPYDDLYPPGPGRDALESRCSGCHGTVFHHMNKDRRAWADTMLRKTTFAAGHVPLFGSMTTETRELITDYLAKNFSPGRARRDLLLDDLRVDEDAAATALYVEYDLPAPAEARRQIHDPFVADDGAVWFTDTGAASVFRLDPDADDFAHRIRAEYRSPNPHAFMHGLTVDSRGHVFYADLAGGRLGELDPGSGEWTFHEALRNGSVIQVVHDRNDDVYFDLVYGDLLGRIDGRTHAVTLWRVPSPDAGLYGLVVDAGGRVWAASAQGRRLLALEPATGLITEYAVPGSPRRLCVGSDGTVWFPQSSGGHLGRLDPASGRITEHAFPLAMTIGYDCHEKSGDVWMTEAMYQSFLRFRASTGKFTYFPMPQSQPNVAPGVPKFEVDRRGRMWYGYRGLKTNVVGYFDPQGNAPAVH